MAALAFIYLQNFQFSINHQTSSPNPENNHMEFNFYSLALHDNLAKTIEFLTYLTKWLLKTDWPMLVWA